MPTKRYKEKIHIPRETLSQITFRNTDILRRFLSSQNKILPRRKTGLGSHAQRHIAREIKRARELGLLGYRGQ